MGFEFDHGANSLAKECHDSSLITLDTKSGNSSRHKRSKSSDPQNRACEDGLGHSPVPLDCGKLDIEQKERQTVAQRKPMPHNEIENSLRTEILLLEDRLQDQFIMRGSLEKALGYSSVIATSNDNPMPKPTKELIREIAVLELEVMYLEHYLLSMYRKAYDQQNITLSDPGDRKQRATASSQPKSFQENFQTNTQPNRSRLADCSSHRAHPQKSSTNVLHDASVINCSEKLNGSGVYRSHSALSQHAVSSALMSSHEASLIGCSEKLSGHGVYRSHSALPQHAVYSALMSPHGKKMNEALYSFRSQPLSSIENGRHATSQVISLAECLGTRIADHVPETPNRLSEDLVRCMGSVYCRLMEPPLVYPVVSSTPTSFSSMSAYSPQYLGDTWSPVCRKDSSFDARLENPFQIEGLREFSGPYNAMIEVHSVCRDSHGLSDVDDVLRNFRSITQRLERVDVRKMKNEEKLAFWINIHNALVMHAYRQHGIPQNYLKRSSLLLKANCNIGGRMINVDVIQNSILGHRTHRPGQWIRTLLSPRLKLRAGDEWQAYAIDHPEPLLHFALCSGNHSDPVVRIYSPKRVFQQLETAKEEYIRATVSIYKEHKILIPKLLESFAKDLNLNTAETVEMIQHYLAETLVIALQRSQVGRTQKCIECIPHNFAFRYLLTRELAGPMIS